MDKHELILLGFPKERLVKLPHNGPAYFCRPTRKVVALMYWSNNTLLVSVRRRYGMFSTRDTDTYHAWMGPDETKVENFLQASAVIREHTKRLTKSR